MSPDYISLFILHFSQFHSETQKQLYVQPTANSMPSNISYRGSIHTRHRRPQIEKSTKRPLLFPSTDLLDTGKVLYRNPSE